MTIEEAIKTAIEYEIKVRDAYLDNLDAIKDELGRGVFKSLGEEEQGHIDYLQARLTEWQESGKISLATLESVVPAKEIIESGVSQLEKTLIERDYGTEREMLTKAIKLEQETSDFYHRMASEMGADGKLFERFLEIEDGHLAIVQAELDYLNSTGRFFDFEEFNLEH